ncbi:NgoPII family restriction endonuclease [Candidatus Woesearchaeota archaeon]|jgi:hypothetical protein|nr:NgoPII family restriction endonuclease [Candidatus Woesearchaeota archaeon]
MVTNILKAILNIKSNSNYNLSNILVFPKNKPSAVNRANNVGQALEYFMKDGFCNTFSENNAQRKQNKYTENFSYLGNQNNPPDIIVKNGDTIEVKKIDGIKKSDLALNSSYPKYKLYSDSSMITQACKDCEPGWKEKDIIYAVGFMDGFDIKLLILIYGDCYAANPNIYKRVKEAVVNGLKSSNLEFSETNELGRVNRVDPLGITNLRIRGMWTIQNPWKVYEDVFNYNKDSKFSLIAMMRKEKFDSFPEEDKTAISKLNIFDVKIQNPDNPAQQLDTKIIRFDIQ